MTESELHVRNQVLKEVVARGNFTKLSIFQKKIFDINEIAIKSHLFNKDRSEALRRKEILLLSAPEMKIFQDEDHPRGATRMLAMLDILRRWVKNDEDDKT